MKHIKAKEISRLDKNGNIYKIGDPVHYSIGSDTYAATVTRATNSKVWARDNQVHADPSTPKQIGHQNWIITPILEGSEREFTYRRKFELFLVKGYKNFGTLHPKHHYYYDWS